MIIFYFKKTIRRLLLAMVVFSVIASTVIGCTKKGPRGPEGQQGRVGEPGPPGPAGPQGPKGGTNDPQKSATTINWQVYTFSKGDPIKSRPNFSGNGFWWTATITDTVITQNIVDKGLITVYLKGADKVIHELNYFTDDVIVSADLEVGKILISSTYDASVDSFKVSIIPGK